MRAEFGDESIDAPKNPWLALFESERPGDRLVDWLPSLGKDGPVFLDRADEISAGPKPFHTGSVLRHMARCMNETAGDPLAVWLAMAHDAGKLTTPANMLPHHYGHEERGQKIALCWASQMGLPPLWADYGKFAAKQHMRAAKFVRMRPGKKLDILERILEKGIAGSFWKLIDADTKHFYSQVMLALGEKVSEWQRAGISRNEQIRRLAELFRK